MRVIARERERERERGQEETWRDAYQLLDVAWVIRTTLISGGNAREDPVRFVELSVL